MSLESQSQIEQRRQELEQQLQQFHDGVLPLRSEKEASDTERRRSRSKRRSPGAADLPEAAPRAIVHEPHVSEPQPWAERLAGLEQARAAQLQAEIEQLASEREKLTQRAQEIARRDEE